MTTLKTSKPSTGSDTDTRKNRWFRLGASKGDLPEFDQILDFYWGGPERRITGLTIRIIAVNAVALILLMIGTLYLGQYQNNLIEAKLETFNAEVDLISIALSEGATKIEPDQGISVDPVQAGRMVYRLSRTLDERIMVFNKNGEILIDSQTLPEPETPTNYGYRPAKRDKLFTLRILKDMAKLIMWFLPDRRVLPIYPEINSNSANDYPDAQNAIQGEISFSAWSEKDEKILLSAAAPLHINDQTFGAVLLTRKGHDIEDSIGDAWLNILMAFMATLVITILLSIYLSGVIARPLRKLAAAAEGVRKGKSGFSDIPDLSARHDEIGELSIVLRQMTHALSERMDSIERFAADVAHELKNPLTSLRSAVETALIVKTDKDRNKLMAIIKHDVERMDRLISDISHASRLDAELSREALQPVDLRWVLNTLLDAHKDPLLRKPEDHHNWRNKTVREGIHLTLDCSQPDEDIQVWGLEGRLAQVFQNLISNAMTFSPPGGTIEIYVIPRQKRVYIMIEDEGPGIPEKKLETIFERFYTERPDSEDYGQHSGLGLSICKQIVTAHGGEISVENMTDIETGKITGARFTVVLNRV